jgi:hypothetical protein
MAMVMFNGLGRGFLRRRRAPDAKLLEASTSRHRDIRHGTGTRDLLGDILPLGIGLVA